LALAPGGGVVDSSFVNRTAVEHVRRVGDELVAGGAVVEFGGRTAVLPQRWPDSSQSDSACHHQD